MNVLITSKGGANQSKNQNSNVIWSVSRGGNRKGIAIIRRKRFSQFAKSSNPSDFAFLLPHFECEDMVKTKDKYSPRAVKKLFTWNRIWRKIHSSSKNKTRRTEGNLSSTSNILNESTNKTLHDTSNNSSTSIKSSRSTRNSQQRSFLNSSVNSKENLENTEITTVRTKEEDTVYYLTMNQVNSYEIIEPIGHGSFGMVYSCFSRRDNQKYAMKIISKKKIIKRTRLSRSHRSNVSLSLQSLKNEIELLKSVSHRNVVKLFEVIDDHNVDNLYMIFELATRGAVMIVPTENVFDEATSRKYFRDVVRGLKYLHSVNIAHLDIKPSNILLGDDGYLKIADFGVSHLIEQDSDYYLSSPGTIAFSSPELISIEHKSKPVNWRAADIWSLGVTLFCFIYGNVPWTSFNFSELFQDIISTNVKFPINVHVNPKLTELISCMLAKDPRYRISMEEIEEHSWVTMGGLFSMEDEDSHPELACEITTPEKNSQENEIPQTLLFDDFIFSPPIKLESDEFWSTCTVKKV